MDPFTEVVLMLVLMVGVPALIVHWLCRKIEYKIASWRPKAFTSRRRYDLVQVIPAPNAARRREAAAKWWPRDTWQA